MPSTAINSLSHLAELSTAINQSHALATGAAESALLHAKRTGELLVEAKSQIDHGDWLAWLAANCEVSTRQAQRYIKVSTDWERISKNDAASYLTIDDATSKPKPHVSHNSGENEWYTPEPFIEAARQVLGTIDLEPQRSALYKATVAFIRCYSNIADDLSESGYSESDIQRIKAQLKHFVDLRDCIRNAAGETLDLKPFEADMRHLIDTYIEADEPRKIVTVHGLCP